MSALPQRKLSDPRLRIWCEGCDSTNCVGCPLGDEVLGALFQVKDAAQGVVTEWDERGDRKVRCGVEARLRAALGHD